MVGIAFRDKTGKYMSRLRDIMPAVDEFMPIEEVGFDNAPLRTDGKSAWVPISNGCNNFCTFCIVPFTRGREVSRPYEDIIEECESLRERGYENVTLLGMNVNSYGADLILGEKNVQVMRDIPSKNYFNGSSSHSEHSEESRPNGRNSHSREIPRSTRDDRAYEINGKKLKPIYVKHLGRLRIPTLFPYLLEDVAKLGFKKVDFMSSNPWDFSDELIDVLARNENITRTVHFALQSGDNEVLRRMNRWYTAEEYLTLLTKMRAKIPNIKFTTDIIVGFCGETDKEFENTVKLCKEAYFDWAYISIYSQRPMTAATKLMEDNVPHPEKARRWKVLDDLINKPKLTSRNIA
jgi:tRNA-2-methylthio-N6-dimethylallyladenosine synthase